MDVEVCVDSLRSAQVAEAHGADRIELCAVLGVGGITPSAGMIKAVIEAVSIPVHVLIRPRAGDFNYGKDELDLIIRDIDFCREAGVAGIVTGVLDAKLQVNWKEVERIRAASKSMKFTFHRAIDWVDDPVSCSASLESLGVDLILSSGKKPTAEEGLPVLREMDAKLTSCLVMPAGGIRAGNAHLFLEAGFRQLHLSALSSHVNSEQPPFSLTKNELLREGVIYLANGDEVRELRESVK